MYSEHLASTVDVEMPICVYMYRAAEAKETDPLTADLNRQIGEVGNYCVTCSAWFKCKVMNSYNSTALE